MSLMKEVKIICPKCNNIMTYKSWLSWILRTPFHWFGKRMVKCTRCGNRSYMGRLAALEVLDDEGTTD